MTIKEIAERSGLAPVTIHNHIRTGKLRAIKAGKVNHSRQDTYIVVQADLLRWLEGRKPQGHWQTVLPPRSWMDDQECCVAPGVADGR
jgi:hypothetical protein